MVIHFSDVTLLFEQWIIFKNLQFIFLFLNIWTLTFYCFRLKIAICIFWDFLVSNHCWAFWLSKLPSNHSVMVTTLQRYNLWLVYIWLLIVSFAYKNNQAIDQYLQDVIQVFQIWHKLCSELTSITAPKRSKSYPNNMNKNCLEELPEMTMRT